jgi:hypothetical protein
MAVKKTIHAPQKQSQFIFSQTSFEIFTHSLTRPMQFIVAVFLSSENLTPKRDFNCSVVHRARVPGETDSRRSLSSK